MSAGYFFESKAVYIKYVGGRAGGIYKFFKKYFVDQGTIELNISWSSNFSDKIFHALPLNFSFSFKYWLLTVMVFQVLFTKIFKANKRLSIQNNIQTAICTNNTRKKQSNQLYSNSEVTSSLLMVNLKRDFIHSNFQIVKTTIQLTPPKSITQTVMGIIHW